MRTRDAGLLLLRLTVGGTVAAHGAQKLLGWFGGHGLEATAAGFEHIGFRPGRAHAMAAGAGELAGGALLAAGLATPVSAAATASTMAVAASVHAPNGWFSQEGGVEFPVILAASALAGALAGPGAWSLDRLLGYRLARRWMLAAALAVTAPVAGFIIARRQRALAAPADTIDLREDAGDAVGADSTVGADSEDMAAVPSPS